MKSFSTTSLVAVTELATHLPTQLANERRRFLGAAAGLVLLGVVPAVRAQGRGMSAVTALPPAPTLRLPDADDKPIDLAGYRGKVVLVNFWATWCPPCRKEFPSLGRVRKLFKATEFEVLAVNVGEDPETVFSFAATPDFPVLFDRDSQAMARWSVKGLPTTLAVDRRGRVALRATGGREFDDPVIVGQLRELINQGRT